jgi:hypothetical protein
VESVAFPVHGCESAGHMWDPMTCEDQREPRELKENSGE